jgi:hypothetical protein
VSFIYLLAGCSATLRVFTGKNPKKIPQKNSKQIFLKKNFKKFKKKFGGSRPAGLRGDRECTEARQNIKA